MMSSEAVTSTSENTRSSTQTLVEPDQGRVDRATSESSTGLERGELIGRYVVLDRLGAGAMGVVFAAYDPELDRKVAIKVLHYRRASEEAQARLVREAQALARVTHPHVVTVHDVGVHDDRVFLAMEYVHGETLRGFLADPERGFEERLRVLIDAGRGLAAAHEAGLVHRDFKPDNVMISARGEVKVMDFGLARAHESSTASVPEPMVGVPESSTRTARISELTEAGAMVGTPAYMAPEQLSGIAADARSDQFAFAVTLHEAVYGVRPYSGGNLAALALAISEGRIDEPPKQFRGLSAEHHRVPPWLRRVVLRALSNDPGDRWSSLDAMLDELVESRPKAGRRRWMLGTGLGFTATLSVLIAWIASTPETIPEPPACSELELGIEGSWDSTVAGELADTLERDPSTRAAAPTVLASFDRFADEWDAANADNCARTRLDASQSERMYDLRAACLRHRRVAFTQLLEVLVEQPETRARAVEASGGLPSVAACSDVAALGLEPELPTDPHARAQVEALRDEIAAVDALIELRQVAEASDRARDIVAQSRDLDYPPLDAEAALVLGRALTLSDSLTAATEQLRRAFFLATTAAHPRVQAEAATELVYTVGYLQQNHALGREWAAHAVAIVARIGEGELIEADAQHAISVFHDAAGEHAESLTAQTRAYELRRQLLPASHPDLARSLNSLALVHHSLGELELALDYDKRALAMRTELFGPDHVVVSGSLNNLALVQRDLGRLDDAKQSLTRAIAIIEGALGPHGNGLPRSLTNLAEIERRLGNLERARELEQRSLALRRETVGDAHPEVADSILSLARIALDEHDLVGAEQLARDGLTRLQRDFAAGHPEIFAAAVVLAKVLEASGELDAGARQLAQILAESRVADLDPEHLRAGKALLARAEAGR